MAKVFFILTFLFLGVVFFFFTPTKIKAQVVINEFSPNSDPRGYGDWIELYIFENVDLSEYYLTHLKGDGSEGNIDIPEPYEYGPDSENGQFKVISVRNYLDNDGDRIRLYKRGNFVPVDDISYGDQGGVCIPSPQGSIGRVFQDGIEGTNLIDGFSNTTKGFSNKENILEPCPTPTLEPTFTLESTPTPTPLPTPTKTPTPGTKFTNTPTRNFTPTKIDEDNPFGSTEGLKTSDGLEKELVFGLGSENKAEPLLESQVKSDLVKEGKKSFLLAFLIMAGGLALLLVGIYSFLKRISESVKSEDEQKQS